MLNAFGYKNMWEKFKEINGSVWGYGKGKYIRELMDEFEKEYIKKNKNRLGHHNVEEFYKE